MNTDISTLIPDSFNDNSKVWIYQNSGLFTDQQVKDIDAQLQSFVNAWHAHGAEVKGFAGILFNKFIVLMADETATGVSGCSTDSSVRMIKEIQSLYNIDLFNRLSLTFIIEDQIVNINLSDLDEAILDEIITSETFYFNNTVLTKTEMLNNWIVPAGKSWLSNYFSKSSTV